MSVAASEARVVVVSGASTGIGRACALHLDARGYSVFAGVRHMQDGEALRRAASDRLCVIRLEVTDEGSIRAAVATVANALEGADPLYALINNAGISEGGPLELIELERLRHQLEVNVVGTVGVTQAFLPLLREAPGRIVNISSIQGFMALPFAGAYAASKHALEAVSDSLRRELRPWGIAVCVIEPGAVASEIWTKSRAAAEERLAQPGPGQDLYAATGRKMLERAEQESRGRPPEDVAEVVHRALSARTPRVRYRVGADAKLAGALAWLLPARAVDWMIARAMR